MSVRFCRTTRSWQPFGSLSKRSGVPVLPVLWRSKAQADLAAILEYIAERSPQAAIELYDDIERVVSQLSHHPYLYRLGRVAGTRELVANPNYIVVYRVSADAIEIVSILHSRQQYP